MTLPNVALGLLAGVAVTSGERLLALAGPCFYALHRALAAPLAEGLVRELLAFPSPARCGSSRSTSPSS